MRKPGTMPRWVILRHDPPEDGSRVLHWDFMLEVGDVLRTWALATEPRGGVSISAEALADHRKAYLDYEGPLSQDRGRVTRWDRGTYQEVDASERRILVILDGERLRGATELIPQGQNPRYWTVTFSAE